MRKINNINNIKYVIYLLIIIGLYILYKKYLYFNKNSYIGINMKCEYCHNNKGTHSHSLDKSKIGIVYDNIASSKQVCNICKENSGSYHIHLI